MIKNFDELEKIAKENPSRSVALAMAEESDALAAIMSAAGADIVSPILVGNGDEIRRIAGELGIELGDTRIVEAEGEYDSAEKAVELVKNGEADCLMKGKTATSTIMKAALNKEKGIRGNSLLSHISIANPPNYPKLLVITDAAMNIAPDLDAKIGIINNAVSISRKLGVDKPKVAVIGAVEKVNPAMPATMDAAVLSKMAQRGQIKNCLIDGPFALDNALSKKSCEVKGIVSEVGGDADILLLPTIEAANVLYKSLSVLTDIPMAGIILGAAKPIILTSRADSDRIKYLSILAGVSLV
ncbi:MAG: bifunctional enoyl-CoA hydratase/phosphate acetyltransferase [Spirochaetales bacterium]|nr:bifunctional enoyl-CoA hydratase/phosphate acetyltransferase [Spirochaetales bacterium]